MPRIERGVEIDRQADMETRHDQPGGDHRQHAGRHEPIGQVDSHRKCKDSVVRRTTMPPRMRDYAVTASPRRPVYSLGEGTIGGLVRGVLMGMGTMVLFWDSAGASGCR